MSAKKKKTSNITLNSHPAFFKHMTQIFPFATGYYYPKVLSITRRVIKMFSTTRRVTNMLNTMIAIIMLIVITGCIKFLKTVLKNKYKNFTSY